MLNFRGYTVRTLAHMAQQPWSNQFYTRVSSVHGIATLFHCTALHSTPPMHRLIYATSFRLMSDCCRYAVSRPLYCIFLLRCWHCLSSWLLVAASGLLVCSGLPLSSVALGRWDAVVGGLLPPRWLRPLRVAPYTSKSAKHASRRS